MVDTCEFTFSTWNISISHTKFNANYCLAFDTLLFHLFQGDDRTRPTVSNSISASVPLDITSQNQDPNAPLNYENFKGAPVFSLQ